MPETIDLAPLAPKEAVDYFRKKGYKTSFDWRDMASQEHAYAFTVAKAMRNDILQDIRAAVDDAIAKGTTFQDFKTGLKPVLQEKGWWGRKLAVDPVTGEEKEVQLGSSRRLKTIFDTNLRTAYAAGKWERVQRTKDVFPYLRYVAVMDERTRAQHRQWHDTVLPADDPFWDKFYPPNGWNCRCSVQQLSERDLARRGLTLTKSDPATPDRVWIDKRNGRTVKVPQGIDPGFAQNPGKARLRALTPPLLDRPLAVPYAGSPAKVPMPLPRAVPAEALYPAGLSDEAYIARFLAEFGTRPGAPFVFSDVTGEVFPITDDLFRTASGRSKLSRSDLRAVYLPLLARTVMDPDEIWHVWEEYPAGRWTLRRKYLARFKIEGRSANAYILYDTHETGWIGVTAFNAKDSYIDKQRAGALVYRRVEK
jgi:SPP1 gp7 family putative phage head morphogenesis protein